MNFPEWLKPGIYGALFGAGALAIAGFSWGGWLTSTNADKMANELARNTVITALVPVCLDRSRTDIERVAKLTKIRDTANYKRRDAVMETGWATFPGADSPDRGLATACMDALKLDAQ